MAAPKQRRKRRSLSPYTLKRKCRLSRPDQRMSNIIWVWICHGKSDRIPAYPVSSHEHSQRSTEAWCDSGEPVPSPLLHRSRVHPAACSSIQLCYSQRRFSGWIYQHAVALLHYSGDMNQCKWPPEVTFSASTVVQSRPSTPMWTLMSIVLFSKDRKQEPGTRITAHRHKHENITST